MFPIWTDEQILGVVQLGSRKRRKIHSSETSLLEALASQAGIAIQKAKLYEETQRNLERIKALHEIDVAISSTLNLATVLEILFDKSALFFPYPTALMVRLINHERKTLETFATKHLNLENWRDPPLDSLGHRTNRVLETKSPVVVRNLQTDAETDAAFYIKNSLVSFISTPLIIADNVIGVLNLYTNEERVFTDEEIGFLTTLAAQAAIAIHNAQLYEETRRSKNQLERTNQYLERSLRQLGSLYTALTPIAAAASTQDLMSAIIDRITDATGAEAALIRVWDKQSSTLPIVGQRGFTEEYLKRVETASHIFDSGSLPRVILPASSFMMTVREQKIFVRQGRKGAALNKS